MHRSPRWVWLALLAILLLAAAVRLWRLDRLPFGYWYDEAHKSLVAHQIAQGERFPVYVTDGQGIEAGYFWLLAGWFRLFGASFFATRYLTAAIGVAAVGATFFAARELYRQQPYADRLGLASAGWLAILLWHVVWSRLGYESVSVALFSAALLGLLAYACRHGSRPAFAAAGVVLGLSQYSNPAARVLPLLVLAVLLILSRGPWRRRLMEAAICYGSALVVYAPLGFFFVQHPEWFLNRMTFASAEARSGGWRFLVESALRSLQAFNVRGDSLVRHNLSLRPVFDPVSSAFMVMGMAAMLVRDQAQGARRAHLAVLAGVAITLLPGVLSDGAPAFGRTLGAAPAAVMLSALGLVRLLDLLGHRRWAAAAVVLAALFAAGLNLRDYFIRYPRQPGMFDAFEAGQWQLLAAASAASTGYLVVDEAALAHPALQLAQRLAHNRLRLINGQACWAFPLEATEATTLAVLDAWRPPAQAAFPSVQAVPILHEPEVYPYGWVLSLPAGTPSTLAGAPPLARFGEMVDLLDAEVERGPHAPGGLVAVTLTWHALQAVPGRYTRFAHLTSSQAPWLAGADAEPCQGWYPTDAWRPGDVVVDSFELALPPDLPPGEYVLVAGLYNLASGERLPVDAPGSAEPDRTPIASILVE